MKQLIGTISIASLSFLLYILLINSNQHVSSNPIAFDPSMLSYTPIGPQQGAPAIFMSGPQQFDPFPSIQLPQYMFAQQQQFLPMRMPMPIQMPLNEVSDRRSNSITGRKLNANKPRNNGDQSEEQKALAGIPLSFIEPEGPSTIPERISDSFSALGEGVKNHFRSLSENFSDTLDDIKDAWKFESANKRNRMS